MSGAGPGGPTTVPISAAPVTNPATLDDTRKHLAWGLSAGVLIIFTLIFISVLLGGISVNDAKEMVTGVFLPLFGVIGPIIAFFFARPT